MATLANGRGSPVFILVNLQLFNLCFSSANAYMLMYRRIDKERNIGKFENNENEALQSFYHFLVMSVINSVLHSHKFNVLFIS